MTPDEFRERGYATIDHIAEYMQTIDMFSVTSEVSPGDIRAQLPDAPPQEPEPYDDVLRDLRSIILPGLTHWQSPDFFGYFPANATGPAILGDLLSSGFGVLGMMWDTSPACTELETHILDWLVEMMGLPESFLSTSTGGGVIQDSASSANLCALIAGRERATQGRTNERGVPHGLKAYTSNQAHSSVEKAMMVAGMGRENLRLIDVDDDFAMRPEALEEAIQDDVTRGYTPAFIAATAGTTSSTAMDPLRSIGEIAKKYDVWLHVDAAHAGTAMVCPEYREHFDGLELADSFCFDAHKWMLTNFDCDCMFVADRKALTHALTVSPEYLRTDEEKSIDYRNWQIPLGRRFRALKLWLVIRHYGVEGIQRHVRHTVALTQGLAKRIHQSEELTIVAPHPLNLVCFRHDAGDEATQELHERLNEPRELFVSHTRLDDQYVIRVAIGSPQTEARHVDALWKLLSTEAQRLS